VLNEEHGNGESKHSLSGGRTNNQKKKLEGNESSVTEDCVAGKGGGGSHLDMNGLFTDRGGTEKVPLSALRGEKLPPEV